MNNEIIGKKIEDEFKVTNDIFINYGYPEEVIDDNIKFTETRFKNKYKTFGPPKCPWVGSADKSFAERIASSVYRCYAVNLRPILRPLILHIRTSYLS